MIRHSQPSNHYSSRQAPQPIKQADCAPPLTINFSTHQHFNHSTHQPLNHSGLFLADQHTPPFKPTGLHIGAISSIPATTTAVAHIVPALCSPCRHRTPSNSVGVMPPCSGSMTPTMQRNRISVTHGQHISSAHTGSYSRCTRPPNTGCTGTWCHPRKSARTRQNSHARQ